MNDWAFEKASKREVRPLQNGMDGTRIVRVVELYLKECLVGEQSLPDVRLRPDEPIQALSWQQVQNHVYLKKEEGICIRGLFLQSLKYHRKAFRFLTRYNTTSEARDD